MIHPMDNHGIRIPKRDYKHQHNLRRRDKSESESVLIRLKEPTNQESVIPIHYIRLLHSEVEGISASGRVSDIRVEHRYEPTVEECRLHLGWLSKPPESLRLSKRLVVLINCCSLACDQ